MKLICLLIFILVSGTCSAQLKNDVWLELKGKAGFLAAHRSVMGHLASEHAFAGEFSVYFRPKNRKLWHQVYKNPFFGATAFFGSTGNRELLGETYGVIGFASFPLINRKYYVLSGKAGCGIAYSTKYFDQVSNQLGMAIGSSINAHICLGLENRILFGDHSINVSIDMTHFSNGASKMPNLGLNLPFLGLGYGYRIHSGIDSNYVHDVFKKSWQFGVMGIASVKEVYPTGGRKYPIYNLNLVGRRFFKPRVGMEVSFDVFSKQAILDYHNDIRKTQLEIIQLGAFVGYILPMDKFHLLVGMGVYVRDKYKPEDPLYHRVGMRYVFGNGINVNLVLKSHWARADYVEYGIGYTFKR